MDKIIEFIIRNPVRIYAFIAALLAVAAHYLPELPVPLYLAVVAAALGITGEVTHGVVQAQRRKALYTKPPVE